MFTGIVKSKGLINEIRIKDETGRLIILIYEFH